MDVYLHYTNNLAKSDDMVLITERALEDLPCRALPVFIPWFPYGTDKSLPIKPKKAPPIISWSKDKSSESVLQGSEYSCAADRERSFTRNLVSSADPGAGGWNVLSEIKPKKCNRAWSVFLSKNKPPRFTQSMSRQFHQTIQRYGLHLHQRAKWIVCEVNCAPQIIGEVWCKINHAIKHAMLPTCNANYQRNLEQIWVYCDVLYCEYIGHFLQRNFQLSGELTLSVHKLGDIFKL